MEKSNNSEDVVVVSSSKIQNTLAKSYFINGSLFNMSISKLKSVLKLPLSNKNIDKGMNDLFKKVPELESIKGLRLALGSDSTFRKRWNEKVITKLTQRVRRRAAKDFDPKTYSKEATKKSREKEHEDEEEEIEKPAAKQVGVEDESDMRPREVQVYRSGMLNSSTNGAKEYFHLDLADMQYLNKKDLFLSFPNAPPPRARYRYLAVLVDSYSRMLYALPMRKKDGESTKQVLTELLLAQDQVGFEASNLKKELEHDKRSVRIQVDHGGEFFNGKVQQLMKSLGITLYSTYSEQKAFLAESKIGAIKSYYSKLARSGQFRHVLMNYQKNVEKLKQRAKEKNYVQGSRMNRGDWTALLPLPLERLNTEPIKGLGNKAPYEMNENVKTDIENRKDLSQQEKDDRTADFEFRRAKAVTNQEKTRARKVQNKLVNAYLPKQQKKSQSQDHWLKNGIHLKRGQKPPLRMDNLIPGKTIVRISERRKNFRIAQQKETFRKGSTAMQSRWAPERYLVIESKKDPYTKLTVYKLKNFKTGKYTPGTFYREQLLPMGMIAEHTTFSNRVRRYADLKHAQLVPRKNAKAARNYVSAFV